MDDPAADPGPGVPGDGGAGGGDGDAGGPGGGGAGGPGDGGPDAGDGGPGPGGPGAGGAGAGRELRLACWRVRDTGLVTAPPRFRRLGGVTRHHRGEGAAWPDRVELVVAAGELVVPGVGRWPLAEVAAQQVSPGPPATFVVRVPGSAQLLAAGPGPALKALFAALAPRQG